MFVDRWICKKMWERDIYMCIYIYMCVCVCVCVCVCILSCFSHVQFFVTQWTVACQAPLSMGFYRQEYWSGLPFPSPGDLPNPGIEPRSLPSPALAGGFFTTTPRKPIICISEITDIDNCWRNHNCKLFLFLFPLEVISLGTYDGKLDFKP